MAKRKQKWTVGDVFLIPTSDGLWVAGQVIGQEPNLMRSATVALFDERHGSIEDARIHVACDLGTLFSILFVTTNYLDSEVWPVIDSRPVSVDARLNPYEHTRSVGFVGAKVIGARIVNDFVDAFYGLAPWDDWNDPRYLDALLISEAVKPIDRLVYKN